MSSYPPPQARPAHLYEFDSEDDHDPVHPLPPRGLMRGDAQFPCMLWLDDHPGEGHGAPEGEDWVLRTSVEEALSFLDQCVFERRRCIAVWVPCSCATSPAQGATVKCYASLGKWLFDHAPRGWAVELSYYHWGVPRCPWHGRVSR